MIGEQGFIAFGDESYAPPMDGFNRYSMAAAVFDPELVEHHRALAQRLIPRGAPKCHWHGTTAARRDEIVAVLETLEFEGVLIHRIGDETERLERRRRKTLGPFLESVDNMGCAQVVLESRGRKDDARDMDFLNAQRAQLSIGALKMNHLTGPQEPLLAVPDAILGAFNEAARGETRWWNRIKERVDVREIDHT